MAEIQKGSFVSAVNDFRFARNKAVLREILAFITGASTQLLSFDEVRQKLKMRGSAERGLKDIPLDAIVGSVGRYNDFTRDFLPRQTVNEERWARVKLATSGLAGVPPIEVYQIGEAYFVKDGNHRVSVARQLGATYIQAYVTEIRTRVPLTPDTSPDDLIIKAEYADFLEQTHLDELRPKADLTVTVPGKYPILAEHIAVHRYFMGIDLQRYIPEDEAVLHWYDHVYMPVIQIVRARGILHYFPGRTETDLYLWLAEHRAALEEELGWQINPEAAAVDLVNQSRPQAERLMTYLSEKILDALSLDTLESGPPPGQWRKEWLESRRAEHLFCEILVPIDGQASGWNALDQALLVAQREGAHLHGLHVVPGESDRESKQALAVKVEFNQRCLQAGISGELVIAVGEILRHICSRSRWTDLVVTNLAHPPGSQPLSRLSSGFRDLIQRCPRPVLATPQTSSALSQALLAFDGSPKAEEALFVATYIAGQWDIPLVVVSVVSNGHVSEQTLDNARSYLEDHGVEATYVLERGPVAEAIIRVSETRECDLLIMGGYGYNPVLEVVLGSAVDQVLRECHKPMLICR